jgi:hypothetical protein
MTGLGLAYFQISFKLCKTLIALAPKK